MATDFYIYFHINPLKNEVFYVGKGSKKNKRAYDFSQRSKAWNSTVKKYGICVDIIYDNLTEEEAFTKEKFYINKIGRRDLKKGTLVNMTDGGEGGCGIKHSDEFRNKCSERMKGHTINNGRARTDEFKEKLSKKFSGEGNPMFGKTSAMKGKNHSEESKQKMSESMKGKKRSEEFKQKMREIRLAYVAKKKNINNKQD